MSRRSRHFNSAKESEASIDMSPLIDVVFILLIFFIVTTVFNNEAGVDVDKPAKMASTKDLDRTSIMMAVTKTGQVYYNGSNIGVAGVRSVVQSMQSANGEEMPLVIQGDQSAQHGVIMKVVGAATEAGVKSISFSTKR